MKDAMKGQRDAEVRLTRKQIAEIERRLSDKEPYASAEKVSVFFGRLTGRTKIGRRTK